MTKPEMNRRLAAMNPETRDIAWRMVREGYGARGIANETHATLKQANAVFEWVERYGFIKIPATLA